jgi:hypothetical protein
MTHDEYEQRQRQLDEQLRAGIELLEAAHRQQTRALDLIWRSFSGEEPGVRPAVAAEPAAPMGIPVSAEPRRTSRRRAWELAGEVREALAAVPEIFDRNHVCQALGFEPDRSSLFRALEDLVRNGSLAVEGIGSGRTPTTYRKTGAAVSPPGA